MDCEAHWQDIFLTKPEYGEGSAPQMDDAFVAPVMSVLVQREVAGTKVNATITGVNGQTIEGTNWLMLAFPSNADAAEIARWRALTAGDMIRVGTASTGGFTDYLTIMDTVDVDNLYNTTDEEWQIVGRDASMLFPNDMMIKPAAGATGNGKDVIAGYRTIVATGDASTGGTSLSNFTDARVYEENHGLVDDQAIEITNVDMNVTGASISFGGATVSYSTNHLEANDKIQFTDLGGAVGTIDGVAVDTDTVYTVLSATSSNFTIAGTGGFSVASTVQGVAYKILTPVEIGTPGAFSAVQLNKVYRVTNAVTSNSATDYFMLAEAGSTSGNLTWSPKCATHATFTFRVHEHVTHLDKAGNTGDLNRNWVQQAGMPAGSLRAVRVNYAVNCSDIDDMLQPDTQFTAKSDASLSGTSPSTTYNKIRPKYRGEITTFYKGPNGLDGTRAYDGADRREMFYYPCYKLREWVSAANPTRSVLRLQMPSNIKQVSAVKLMAYSLTHKRSVGIQQQHERKEDDWFALRLKEVHSSGMVLSNNRFADGCFHVIHAGNGNEKKGGSVELYDNDPAGLACASFTPTNLPSLSVEITDRLGQEAHFGRMHLWLRVLVTRG